MAETISFSGSICSGHYRLKIDLNVNQNSDDNTSNITAKIYLINDWSLNISERSESQNYIIIDGIKYNFATPAVTTTGTHLLATVNSNPINHNDDGSKSVNVSCYFAITATISGTYYSNISANTTITLSPITMTSTLSFDTFTIGEICDINIIKANSDFTHTITYYWGDTSETGLINNKGYKEIIADKTIETVISWLPSEKLASIYPNYTSGVGTLICDTYNGNIKVGTKTYSFVCNFSSDIKPVITSFTVEPDNSHNEIVDSLGMCIQGISKIRLSCNATGVNNSSIVSYSISGGYTASLTSMPYTGEVINKSGNISFECVAVDSRNRKSQPYFADIQVLPYSPPEILSFIAERNSTDNSKVNIKVRYSYSDIEDKNSALAVLYYKKSNETEWTEYGEILNDSLIELENFSTEESYNFRVIVTDTFLSRIQEERFISTMKVLLDFKAGGKGLGVGKIAESDSMEVGMPVKFMDSVYVYSSTGESYLLEDYIKLIVNNMRSE